MSSFHITLSSEVFYRLSPATQREILSVFEPSGRAHEPLPAAETATPSDEQPAALSTAQAKKLVHGCGERTRSVLKAIATRPNRRFQLSTVARQLGSSPETLRGAWTGITKRTRTVLDDRAADLIWWTEAEDDSPGEVSDVTYRSLRKAFDL